MSAMPFNYGVYLAHFGTLIEDQDQTQDEDEV
jgi:hypothetical protein